MCEKSKIENCTGITISLHMYRFKFYTFFTFILSLENGMNGNEPQCHKNNRPRFDKTN